jgi:hypothetical protein
MTSMRGSSAGVEPPLRQRRLGRVTCFARRIHQQDDIGLGAVQVNHHVLYHQPLRIRWSV